MVHSSATLLLATLALGAASTLAAPIDIPNTGVQSTETPVELIAIISDAPLPPSPPQHNPPPHGQDHSVPLFRHFRPFRRPHHHGHVHHHEVHKPETVEHKELLVHEAYEKALEELEEAYSRAQLRLIRQKMALLSFSTEGLEPRDEPSLD